MASQPQFQLFPSPVSRPKSGSNPFRRPSKKDRRQQPPSPVALEEVKPSLQTESVLIQIIEDTNHNIHPLPQEHLTSQGSRVATPDISSTPKAERSGSALSQRKENKTPLPVSNPHSPAVGRAETRQDGPSQHLSAGASSSRAVSPIVAMRSMFPRYNPNVPLTRQEYYPQNDSSQGTALPAQLEQGSMPCPPAEVDAILGPRTVPPDVVQFPNDTLISAPVQYSDAPELESLWESANGQKLKGLLGTFNLRLERTDHATFTFGDPLLPFYTMQTFTNNAFSLVRHHPLKSNRKVQVMMLNLEDPARRQPPNDGLVTTIFSKLAGMVAVEQAAELTRTHRLAPSEAMEVETNALKRAAAQETCRLIWREHGQRYELQHPALLKNSDPSLIGDDGNPLSRVQTKNPGTLHITVSKAAGDRSQPPTILVTNPTPPSALLSATTTATTRTSTVPLADSDEPLASLDLGTMCLSISAGLTTAIIPSLYAIDSLIAAILAVALSDEATNRVLSEMELYIPGQAPPARSIRLQRRTSIATTFMTTKSFTGKLVATLAERQEAEEEAQLMSQLKKSKKPKIIEKGGTQGKKKKGKNGKRQIIIDEIDLEKYDRYGSDSSREGEKVPGGIRATVHLVVWLLEVFVTLLTAGVKCFVWVLVKASQCVTSEKY